ncbi:MAG TPA: hypothetical protein VF666_20110 [Pyrinomonadaceae bacterium]|jgi:hypothetical protein
MDVKRPTRQKCVKASENREASALAARLFASGIVARAARAVVKLLHKSLTYLRTKLTDEGWREAFARSVAGNESVRFGVLRRFAFPANVAQRDAE